MISRSNDSVFGGVIGGLCDKFNVSKMLARFILVISLILLPFKVDVVICLLYALGVWLMPEPIIILARDREHVIKDRQHYE
jgi:phage shock protein PspC (stress-responsive transcriptional regulator)